MHWDARIGARLKLRDLSILLAVAQAGSMAKAARQLAVSQPAVSKAIADIEQVLGVSLLDRSPRGVEPTEYGRALMRRGTAVFDELRQGVREIEFLADPTTGELRIGAGEFVAGTLVSRVIEQLSQRYPRVVFHVHLGERVGLLRALRERRVELVIVRLHGPAAEEQMDATVLHDDTFVVVAGAKTGWARSRTIALADLVHEPWTFPPLDSWSGALIQETFRAAGLDFPQTTVFTLSQQLRMNLAASGRFLTVIPDYQMRSSATYPAVVPLPIALSATRRQVGIVTLKNRAPSPVARLFIDCARKVGNQLAKHQR